MDDSDIQNKIIELENKVTELEEEKGNLQLRLVDFEDMTGNVWIFLCQLDFKLGGRANSYASGGYHNANNIIYFQYF